MGAYMSTPEGLRHLKDITLRDMALMNNVSLSFLQDQFLDMHAHNWYGDEYAHGAFALFRPGEFTGLMPHLMVPAAHGRLHFASESLSSGHAWIVGALNSAYRAVAEVLAVEQRQDLLELLVQKWGTMVCYRAPVANF